MSDLQFILLIIGCLFVAGLYCWEVFFRSEPKKKNDFLNAIDDLPDAPSFNPAQFEDSAEYKRSLLDLGNMIAQGRKERSQIQQAPEHINIFGNDNDEDAENIPSLRKTPVISDESVDIEETARFSAQEYKHEDVLHQTISDEDVADEPDYDSVFESNNESIADSFDPDMESVNDTDDEDMQIALQEMEDEVPEVAEENSSQPQQSDSDLIILFITSPAQTMFNGLSISKAADEVGMVYGHMNIFHHFGPGKLHSGQPLFSMANMFEPGSFDLGRMADLRTKGIVLFMYPPASIEPEVVFELFLNTARRISKTLTGELKMANNQKLDNAGIEILRKKAESLSEQQY